ncbi:MAG: glycosyltransferase, partial [Methylosarcina sp.]
MKTSLCLIVWNELQGCKTDVPKLPRDDFDEIFAVDGGSTDGTVEYLESQGIPVYLQPKRGLNAAYVHANNMATGDAVVVFFPKGTLPTDDLRKFRPL